MELTRVGSSKGLVWVWFFPNPIDYLDFQQYFPVFSKVGNRKLYSVIYFPQAQPFITEERKKKKGKPKHIVQI